MDYLRQVNSWCNQNICVILAVIIVVLLVLSYMHMMPGEGMYGAHPAVGAQYRGAYTSGADLRHQQKRSDISHDFSGSAASAIEHPGHENLVSNRFGPEFNEVPNAVHTYYEQQYDPTTGQWLRPYESFKSHPHRHRWADPMYDYHGEENNHMAHSRARMQKREVDAEDALRKARTYEEAEAARRAHPGCTQSAGCQELNEKHLATALHGN